MLTTAGFNRRMRKTARPVVWKAHGAQSLWAHPILWFFDSGTSALRGFAASCEAAFWCDGALRLKFGR